MESKSSANSISFTPIWSYLFPSGLSMGPFRGFAFPLFRRTFSPHYKKSPSQVSSRVRKVPRSLERRRFHRFSLWLFFPRFSCLFPLNSGRGLGMELRAPRIFPYVQGFGSRWRGRRTAFAPYIGDGTLGVARSLQQSCFPRATLCC